jgi:hypothetical protein
VSEDLRLPIGLVNTRLQVIRNGSISEEVGNMNEDLDVSTASSRNIVFLILYLIQPTDSHPHFFSGHVKTQNSSEALLARTLQKLPAF